LYDAEQLERSRSYQRANLRAKATESSVSTLVLLAALALGWFGWIDSSLRQFTEQPVVLALGFFAVYGMASAVISLPFDIYRTFSIEERFGFNQTTVATFIADKVKGTALTALIGGAILALIVWLHGLLGTAFVVSAWVLITLISVVMFAWGTSVITPLFNKLTPLPEGELRSALVAYCSEQGYAVGRLFVMDGSKRSSKANAFFAGLGKTKTIVLYDTLIEKLSTEEVVAVLAHEVGHYKRRHTLGMLLLSSIQTLALLALLGLALGQPVMSEVLGAEVQSFHIGAVSFFLLLTPLNLLLDLALSSYSRRNEYDADKFSIATYPGPHLAAGLRKISIDSLANLNPHPWYVAVHYTHPPLVSRLSAID
jgi:STE24 endopeptidase